MSYTVDFEDFEHNGKVYSGTASYDVEWSSETTDQSGYFTSSDNDEDDCAVVESYSLDELFEINGKSQVEVELSDPVFKAVEEAISHIVDNHCDSLELEKESDDSDYNSDGNSDEDPSADE
jgi:hypothetical protein